MVSDQSIDYVALLVHSPSLHYLYSIYFLEEFDYNGWIALDIFLADMALPIGVQSIWFSLAGYKAEVKWLKMDIILFHMKKPLHFVWKVFLTWLSNRLCSPSPNNSSVCSRQTAIAFILCWWFFVEHIFCSSFAFSGQLTQIGVGVQETPGKLVISKMQNNLSTYPSKTILSMKCIPEVFLFLPGGVSTSHPIYGDHGSQNEYLIWWTDTKYAWLCQKK